MGNHGVMRQWVTGIFACGFVETGTPAYLRVSMGPYARMAAKEGTEAKSPAVAVFDPSTRCAVPKKLDLTRGDRHECAFRA
jgi:hypothetical protein